MIKLIMLLLSLSFLPISFHIGIGVRIFDILILILFYYLIKIKKIIIDKFTIFLFLMFVFSILSLYGLSKIPFQLSGNEINFHIKNILMGSARYIEIIIFYSVFYYLIKKYAFFANFIIKYLILGIILNDIYALILYLYNLLQSVSNNILQFIINGKFIYHMRFFESVGSVNGSAGFLLMTLPLLWYGQRIMSKKIWFLFICLHILLLLLTGSKSAYFGLLLFFFIISIFDRKVDFLRFFSIIIIGILFLSILWQFIPEPVKKYRIEGMFKGDKSTSERIVRAKKSIYILQDSPLFGYGFSSTYQYLFKKYAEGNERNWIRGVSGHNTYVTLFVQIGVIGVLIFIFFIFYVLYLNFKIILKRSKDFMYYLSISLVLFIIFSATDDMLFIPLNFFVFFTLISIFFILRKRFYYERFSIYYNSLI